MLFEHYHLGTKADLVDRLLVAERRAAEWEQRFLPIRTLLYAGDSMQMQMQQKRVARSFRNCRDDIFLVTNYQFIASEVLNDHL